MLIFKDIHIEKLRLVEHLPQVGSKKYVYKFENGLFVLENNFSEPIDYIINNDGEFLIGVGHYKLNKKGESLISAGRVMIDGKITYIDNDSGHYNPDFNHTKKIAEFLRSQNVTSSNLRVINVKF